MSTLVFDIETVGEKWSDLDVVTQGAMLGWARRTATSDVEREKLEQDVREGLSFSPFTGSIVSIGLYDVERRQGVVYYAGDVDTEIEYGEFVLRTRTEKEMLVDFWDGAQSYDTFVTYNGRSFDVPFLNIRSAVLDVRPRVDIAEKRYLHMQNGTYHVDLLDQFSQYGSLRRPSLHLACRAFGIVSPKMNGGGENVAELFHQKKFRDIAEYNTRDIIATTALYKKWLTHLAPLSFVNRLEGM